MPQTTPNMTAPRGINDAEAFARLTAARARVAALDGAPQVEHIGANVNDSGQASMTLPLSVVERLLDGQTS